MIFKNSSSTSTLPWIQVLRGIAAMIVAAGHALNEILVRMPQPGATQTSFFFYWGYGVDLFFVVSGFIMIHSAGGRFHSLAGSMEFFLRRLVRIAPLYTLATIGVAVSTYLLPHVFRGQPPSITEVALSILFVPYARASGDVLPVLAVGWTLNYEMLFYVLFALAMLFYIRIGVALLLLTLCSLSLVGALIDIPFTALAFWANSIILEFCFGILIGLLYRSGLRPPRALVWFAGILGFVLSLAALATQFDFVPRFLGGGLPALCCVFAAVFAPFPPQTVLTNFFVKLGDASYSLYLFHMYPVRITYLMFAAVFGLQVPLGPFMVAASLGACLTAFVLHRYIEAPVTNTLNRRLRRVFVTIPRAELSMHNHAILELSARPGRTPLAAIK